VFDFLIDAILKDKEFFYLGGSSVFEPKFSSSNAAALADTPKHEHVVSPRNPTWAAQ